MKCEMFTRNPSIVHHIGDHSLLPLSPPLLENYESALPLDPHFFHLSYFFCLNVYYKPEFNMGVERKIITRGNGSDSPAAGDKVSIHYTGWIYDAKKANKGFQGKQ